MSKTKLIETAAEIIYRQGWNATGINQILSEAKIPKGSFYYYFHSKDELGVEIVRHQARKLRECYERTLLNDAFTGADGVAKFFEEQLAERRLTEWRYGCPIGSFSNEIAATTENIAAACREAFNEFVSALTAAVKRGDRDGTINVFDGSAESLSYAIAFSWQGALLYMKTLRNEHALNVMLERLGNGYFKHSSDYK